ncbi:MAG TPA: hypothetical protein VH143_27305 [Kofleriaceae bacterium]|jgi:hypothetical protein|nr:hypothetical protein [Kofleriaceae bacterium]
MRRFLPTAIVIAGWVIVIAVAYPGVMSLDSFDQLLEARAWFFTDSHPPLMAALWGVIDRAVPGPMPLLVLQTGCFLFGMFWLLSRAMGRSAAAITAVVLLLFPPIVTPMLVIWKDCLMAGFLALGAAGLTSKRRWLRAAALAPLWLATAVRYNALAATLPLITLLFTWRPNARPLVRYAVALASWLVISIAALAANAALTDRQMHIWQSSLALTDIVGTATMTDVVLPDADLAPLLVPTGVHVDRDYQQALRTHYKPADFAQLIGPPDPLWSVPISGSTPAPAEQVDAITRAWRAIVLAHPFAYTEYRLDTFAEVLGLHAKFNGVTVVPHATQWPSLVAFYKIPAGWPTIQMPAEHLLKAASKRTPLFRPYIYFVLALLLLPFARKHRDIAALLLSGIVMELSLLPLAVTPDYRYSHWLVITTCIAVCMLVARRARER